MVAELAMLVAVSVAALVAALAVVMAVLLVVKAAKHDLPRHLPICHGVAISVSISRPTQECGLLT